jgi:hypothetical protein
MNDFFVVVLTLLTEFEKFGVDSALCKIHSSLCSIARSLKKSTNTLCISAQNQSYNFLVDCGLCHIAWSCDSLFGGIAQSRQIFMNISANLKTNSKIF